MKCGTAVAENVGDKKRSVKMKRCVCVWHTRGIFTVAERYGKYPYSAYLLLVARSHGNLPVFVFNEMWSIRSHLLHSAPALVHIYTMFSNKT